MPNNNNDVFNITQSNGALDSDINLNGISANQIGAGQLVWDTQSISSGGNSQSNDSAVTDNGLFNFGSHSQNDDYTVTQGNNLFDSDANQNVFVDLQGGFGNIAGTEQSITSGGNSQGNSSAIMDGGFTGLFDHHSNNDAYDVTQFNGMRDEDANMNTLHVDQLSALPLFGNVSLTSQDISSGGNSQDNTSAIDDSGFTFLFGGHHDNNDSFTVDQSNQMLDSDMDINSAHISQIGGLQMDLSSQDISSGGNSQSNASDIGDMGSAGWFSDHENNDMFDIGQSNQMSDTDANGNQLIVTQGLMLELADTSQSIDSGGNSQSNTSGVYDLGMTLGFGDHSNNDDYSVSQGNLMLDNDLNMNAGSVTQAGFGNFASLDQSTTSGNNSQSNSSYIFDSGFGFSTMSNNDTYDVEQTNLLTDNDSNQSLATVTEIGGPGDFATLSQMISSGDNSAGNNSVVFDFAS